LLAFIDGVGGIGLYPAVFTIRSSSLLIQFRDKENGIIALNQIDEWGRISKVWRIILPTEINLPWFANNKSG